jgi:predicted PurR-regulated permease PerM
MHQAPARDLPRIVLAVLFIGALLAASLWVLRPFLPSIVWAALIVIATWPLMRRVQRWVGGRRGVAVAVMTLVLVALFLVPFVIASGVLVGNIDAIAEWLKTWPRRLPAEPPGWLASIPGFGTRIASAWREVAEGGTEGLATTLSPYAEDLARFFVAQVGNAGVLTFQFFVTVVLAGVLYARGERVGDGARQFARRLAGDRGEEAVILAAQATRAVAFGVVVTALVQAVVGGFGLALAGVPAWAILTAVMFLSSLAQIGSAPIMALAAVWTFAQGDTGWGIALVVWAILVGSLDNVLRPILIGREAHLPVLLVFGGVIGGLIAFGPVGLFAGPVVLAVTFTLLKAWVRRGRAPADGVTA